MRLTHLGVVFDAAPLKRGAEEAKQSLQTLGATAQQTAHTIDKAASSQIRTQEQLSGAANKRANEERRAAAALKQRVQEERKAVEMAAETLKRQADAAQAAAMRMAALHEQALRMDVAMTNNAAAFGLGEAGANRLRSAVTGLMAPMLQTTGSANVLASTLGSLAIGNAGTVGILAGMVAIASAYDAITASADAARRKAQESFAALDALRKKEQQGNLGDTPENLVQQLRAVADARKRLQEAQRELAESQRSLDAVGAKTGVVGRSAAASADVARLQQTIAASTRVVEAGTREINRLTREANAEYSSLQTERLAGLVRGNAATVQEQAQLRDRLRNLQAELNTLTLAGGDPSRRAQLVSDIQAITSVYDAQAKAATTAGRAQAKAMKDVLKEGEDLVPILRDLGIKADEGIKSEGERAKALKAYIAAQREKIDTAKAEYQALQEGAPAYKQFTEVQFVLAAGEKAVAEARRLNANATEKDLQVVRAYGQELARQELLTKNATGANPTKPPVVETNQWLNQLRDAVGIVQLIGQAFGDVGRTIADVGTGAQSLVSGLQRASDIKNKAGQAVSLGGALSGAAGASGVISGIGAVGAVVGGVVQIANALRGNMGAEAERQRELYRIFAESVATFRQSVDDAKLSTFQREQQSLAGTIAADVEKAQAMTGARFSTLSAGAYSNDADGLRSLQSSARFIAQSAGKEAGKLLAFADALEEIIRNAEIGAAALRERATADLSAATQDSNVALLRARGRTAEADAMQRELEITRQIAAARKQFDGLDGLEEYISLLKEVSAAVALAADAERTRQQQAFGLDLTQRRQTLNGDARGAFVTGQTIQTNAALVQAQQLLDAGTITAAMFEELRVLLGDEMVQALKDFDAAVQQAKQAVLDDLAVRALVAQGKATEADSLRVEIANRKELEGVTDAALRQQILYVQGLEATAREQARLADEQRAAAETVAEIDRRMLDVLRTLDPAKAAELEAKQREIDRAKELASAASEMIRLRLEELYAMEDAARAQAKLTEEMARQAKMAEELASLTASVEDDYLRATGRTFEADMQRLKDDKETRLKAAQALGASQDTIAKIIATFDAKMNALVAATMAGETVSPAGALGPLDGGLRATTIFASVSDTTALRMLDVQLSQLTVLREIAAKGGAGGSGITVQITVTGSPLVAQTPQQVGRDLAAQLVPTLDEYHGRRLGIERRLVGNPVL